MLNHFSCVWLFVTLWIVACQTPLSMRFSMQEYWSGLPFPSPGDLWDPENESVSYVSYVGRQVLYHWEALNTDYVISKAFFFLSVPRLQRLFKPLLRTLMYLFKEEGAYLVVLICSVQFSDSVVSNSVTPWTTACQVSLSITSSRSLLKLVSFESVMPSKHLILCLPLFLLPSVFPSIRVFSNESALHIRWPKYWSFRFSTSPSNRYSGLISFKMDWLDLLAVQETLKSLLQHHSSKASIFWRSVFFKAQVSHPYMTTVHVFHTWPLVLSVDMKIPPNMPSWSCVTRILLASVMWACRRRLNLIQKGSKIYSSIKEWRGAS